MTDAAQPRMGRPLDLHPEPVDVGALARKTVRMVAEAGGAAEGDVVMDAPPGIMAASDRRRLERAVWNIVGNALKYSPRGAGGEEGAPVQVAVRGDGAWVVIVVRDRGVGIPADELPHIFEHVYRASAAGKIVGAHKCWDDGERGQLARWVRAGKLPALPVLLRAYEKSWGPASDWRGQRPSSSSTAGAWTSRASSDRAQPSPRGCHARLSAWTARSMR